MMCTSNVCLHGFECPGWLSIAASRCMIMYKGEITKCGKERIITDLNVIKRGNYKGKSGITRQKKDNRGSRNLILK